MHLVFLALGFLSRYLCIGVICLIKLAQGVGAFRIKSSTMVTFSAILRLSSDGKNGQVINYVTFMKSAVRER